MLEGILIFTCEKLLKLLSYKIFVDASEATQIFRRIKRDTNERGRDFEEVEYRYQKDVAKSYEIHVKPSSSEADIIITNNTGNNFVGLEMIFNHIATVATAIKRKLESDN